jgi:NAD(P) transhydrogenase subunit alpha
MEAVVKVGVLAESRDGETRVALVPDLVGKYADKGHQVWVQAGAGVASGHADSNYAQVGATVLGDAAAVLAEAEVVIRVQVPSLDEVEAMTEGSALLAHLWPLQEHDLVAKLAERKVTAFSMDMVPRITRAQAMDSLSAMSTVSGYKAVLLAAAHLGKFCPMLMTAAGTIRPSRALILGAGVAGLTAIGTARRLGAIVEAFDVRPAVKEQVQSLGAKFVEFSVEDAQDKGGYAKALDEDQQARQLELIAKHIVAADIVITTALIPGRKAPVLVTAAMLQSMQAGSVVIDLAAIQGGNCEGAEADKTVVKHDVTIMGPTNLPATVPVHASQMYAKVISNLLFELSSDDGALERDMDNEVTSGCLITDAGEVVHGRVRTAMGLPEQAPAQAAAPSAAAAPA